MFNGGQPNFVSSDILADSQRYNMDTKANTYGKLLLDLCKNTGHIIANGTLYQDKHRGSFTFFNRNGSQSWGQFLFINAKFHSNSFLSIPESLPIPLVLRKVNSNSIPIPKKSIPYQFHTRMRLLIHIEQLYNNLI